MYSFVNNAPDKVIPKVTGKLRRSSMEILGRSKLTLTTFEVWFGFGAEYAKYVDEGRTPGKMVPRGVIEAWCIRRGIDIKYAKQIRWGIYHHGIKGKHFWDISKQFALIVFREEMKRALIEHKLLGARVSVSER